MSYGGPRWPKRTPRRSGASPEPPAVNSVLWRAGQAAFGDDNRCTGTRRRRPRLRDSLVAFEQAPRHQAGTGSANTKRLAFRRRVDEIRARPERGDFTAATRL